MAGASLLLLLDDIASTLDDVATMTKVAAYKTAGVLSDDLALNAHQLSGVGSDREWRVVWAVAKGSLRNKLLLVPGATALSVVAPSAISPLLITGGLYLCYEGAEKIIESIADGSHATEQPDGRTEAARILGAVRTDFILSAEIIVIALGTVSAAPLALRVSVLAAVGLLMTAGVYGLVAAIVKLDDVGLWMVRMRARGAIRWLGLALVNSAPRLMRLLAVAGTAAMFIVGGGIVVHNVASLAAWLHRCADLVTGTAPVVLPAGVVLTVLQLLSGFVIGVGVFAATKLSRRLFTVG